MSEQLLLADAQLGAYLARRGLVPEGTETAVEAAGDGNINWVRRARAGGRSFIVKQARPALERFPEYRVSTERIVFEHRYFEWARRLPEAKICPEIVDFDERERVLILEDLGTAERLDAALARGADVRAPAVEVARFLAAVHASTSPGLAARFANEDLPRLHGAHIFELPLRENDFPLPPELGEAAAELRADAELVSIADGLHARYLEPRGALVHGDVQAGNILLTPDGPKLLDAEIAHIGDPAFDLGVFVAHLLVDAVAGHRAGHAQQTVEAVWQAYGDRLGGALAVPFPEVARYAGIELVRRTIGAARVDAVKDAEPALRVLRFATAWLRDPPKRP